MRLCALWSRTLALALLLVPASAAEPGVEDVQGAEEEAPLPPTNLRAQVDGDDVVLTWDAPPVGSPDAYRIYRIDLPGVGGGTGGIGLPSVHVSWPPLRQVDGNDTSYRDTTVDLAVHQYVYVVTATYGVGGPHGPQANGAQESPPSNPAYTWNTFGSCPWFEVNVPEPLLPPVEVHVECIRPLLGPAWTWPLHAEPGSI